MVDKLQEEQNRQLQTVRAEVDRLNVTVSDVTMKLGQERKAARLRNDRQLLHIRRLETKLKDAGLPVPPFPTEREVQIEGAGQPA